MPEDDIIPYIMGRFEFEEFGFEKELVVSFLIRFCEQYNTSLHGTLSLDTLMSTAEQWYIERTEVFKNIRNGFSIMQNSAYFIQHGDAIKLTKRLLSKIF